MSDQCSGFHGIVIPGTLRDSIFVLEGFITGVVDPAVAGIRDVLYMCATGVFAAVFFHDGHAGTGGENFCNDLDLYISKVVSIEEV